MSTFTLERYTPGAKAEWNAAVGAARNGTFLFRREYMDYHADRFEDRSLLVRDHRGRLAALFAAATSRGEETDVITAHPGLTYGGLILPMETRGADVLTILTDIASHYAAEGFRTLVCRPVPHIYHRFPCEEDIYALWRLGATMDCCQLSATIENPDGAPSRSQNMNRLIAKGIKAGVQVVESQDYTAFHRMLAETLAERHNAAPVHSLAEIELLASRFPDNIRLWMAVNPDGVPMAAVMMFLTDTCAHTQYICSTSRGRECGALPVLLSRLAELYSDRRYFDFGTSNEDHGRFLNEGLLRQKNGFGARGTVYPSYRLEIKTASEAL